MQGPEGPVVGLCICDAEHRTPLQESRSGRLPTRITAQRTLSWSSWAIHPLGGTFRFPQSLRRSTESNCQFLNPLVVPEVAQLSHSYTSTTRGSRIASQSRAQWPRVPSAPRAGSSCGSCACGACAVPNPRAARAAAIRAGSALGLRAAGEGPRGAPQCGWRAGW